eukprot:COSAG01_NODE_58359_length_306_cov_1.362319_1_plen_101_part_11
MNAYPRYDLILEIHAVRYYCTVPHAPRKLLPSWVILQGPIVVLTDLTVLRTKTRAQGRELRVTFITFSSVKGRGCGSESGMSANFSGSLFGFWANTRFFMV